jgi:hypothetical protein
MSSLEQRDAILATELEGNGTPTAQGDIRYKTKVII